VSQQQTVRDAMVPEPTTLGVTASAQDAGRCLEREDMRAVFVVDDEGRLVGVITRKTLVREVVAKGRDPREVPLREIAEPPIFTLEAALSLDEGFHKLEELDLERVPVVEEGGRLVGVLSRAVVQRRLAEDEPPELDPDPGSVVL
jgi:CBS domain-containing protein